jgi:CheY-like chemotaxis protein
MATRLLVVEDDSELREVLVLALEAEGYAVSSAENGIDAMVRLYFTDAPDAIVLNLHMPVMSGGELMDVVRGDPTLARLPIVIVSGGPVPPEVVRSAGAVLSKPFDVEALCGAIQSLIMGRLAPHGPTTPPDPKPPPI